LAVVFSFILRIEMKYKEIRLSGTTDVSGDLVVNATTPVFGLLYAVRWVDGDFADGVDAVISTQGHEAAATLLTLSNADDDAWYYPRVVVQNAAGVDLTGLVGGDRDLPLMVGVPRLVVSSGGSVLTGGCILYYIED
jgi:hypothetical protein